MKSSARKRTVTCRKHGEGKSAFVCQHLVDELNNPGRGPLGFFRPQPVKRAGDLQAWCGACDRKLDETDGWNEESQAFANIRLLCEGCYETLRRTQLVH